MANRVQEVLSRMQMRMATIAAGEDGQGLVEYALIIALVSVAAILALTFLGGNIAALFSEVADKVVA